MKQTFTTILLLFIMINSANAGTRYENLTYDYFYGKNSNVSLNVKVTIAKDKHTSPKVLEILTHDKHIAIWLLANDNLKNSL